MSLKTYAVRGSIKDNKNPNKEIPVGRYIVDAIDEKDAIKLTKDYLENREGVSIGKQYWHARKPLPIFDKFLGTRIRGVR